MTVLVADNIADCGIAALQEAGHTVVEQPGLQGEDGSLTEAVTEHQPEVLVVRSTLVQSETLEVASNLELIVRAGAGYNTIDVDGASGRGIFVANCPGKNATAVAELTLGLLLSLDRRIPDNVSDSRAGTWNKKAYAQAEGIKGRTLGVIGVGNIGWEVARLAQAFEMRVVAWSRSLTSARANALGAERMESPEDVARAADAVTIHLASTPDTHQLADRSFFEAMSSGGFFINTSRSDIVDEDALTWALNNKGIRAAVDVVSGEPGSKQGTLEHPLRDHPNLYITHHIGASTQQAQDATAMEAARVITTYGSMGHVPNCVNLASQTPATHQITVRHIDKVGVLAAVLDEVRKADWNVQEMDNLIFEGARAASANIRFDGTPDETVIDRIREHEDVFAVTLIEL